MRTNFYSRLMIPSISPVQSPPRPWKWTTPSPSTHQFLSVKTSFGSADEDYVKFPNNLTSQEVFDEGVNVRLYNKTSDNNASLILFKLKQLLQSETERGEEEREGAELGERQTRIVYINNKRVELESDSEH